jgi:hypothetical protein
MVGNIRAYRAIVMGNSILMMMECKPHDKKTEIDKQDINKFSVHYFND